MRNQIGFITKQRSTGTSHVQPDTTPPGNIITPDTSSKETPVAQAPHTTDVTELNPVGKKDTAGIDVQVDESVKKRRKVGKILIGVGALIIVVSLIFVVFPVLFFGTAVLFTGALVWDPLGLLNSI